MAGAKNIEVRPNKSAIIESAGPKNNTNRKPSSNLAMPDKPGGGAHHSGGRGGTQGMYTATSTTSTATKIEPIPQTNFAIAMLVMFCFNFPLGALALYFSLRAAAAYRDGEKARGAFRSRVSILLSLFGIMLTMVIVCSVVTYIAVNKHSKRSQRRPNSSGLGF